MGENSNIKTIIFLLDDDTTQSKLANDNNQSFYLRKNSYLHNQRFFNDINHQMLNHLILSRN